MGNAHPTDDYYRNIIDEYNVSKISGYPDFAQYDPRHDFSEDEEEYILFLAIEFYGYIFNYGLEIRWGDNGVCNFFY